MPNGSRTFLPLLGGESRGEVGRRSSLFSTFCFAVVCCFLLTFATTSFAVVFIPFDDDWKFFKGDAPGAEQPGFDDSNWRTLNLPHDWSIEGPFSKTNKTGGSGAWLPHGVGWYRKELGTGGKMSPAIYRIKFDGVMQNSEVWFNGVSLGKRPNGYVGFDYDLTPYVKYDGAKNIIAVRTDTSAQPASRWYSGAGIYRHVRCGVAPPIYVLPHSLFVTTPTVSNDVATVLVQSTITNSTAKPEKVSLRILVNGERRSDSPKTNLVDCLIPAHGVFNLNHEFAVREPQVWSLENRYVYKLVLVVEPEDKNLMDVEKTAFAIRTAEFKSDSGFWLNGKNIKLKGVCLHHDGGAFGAAVPLSVWERRLTNLRELGVNAIRTAHNPVAPEFLDLCDRMGFVVMNELFDCWTVKKNPHDYAQFFNEWSKRDLADTIRRDRNHPSVILWSVGNEIKDTPKQEHAKAILKGLVEVCHENDPTRPVTQALFRPNTSGDYTNGLADMLDVIGTNYRDQELLEGWRAKAGRKIVGTEQGHERRTWLAARDNPQHSGQFLWAGIDYLGESRSWPRMCYAGGLLDRTGEIKPMAYERQSWWSDKPMVKMVRRVAANDVLPEDPGWGGEERHTQVQFADWTPRNLEPHDENVEVYSNCDEVELFLNGKSLGSKPINKDASPHAWKVAFEKGTLKAVARNSGKEIVTDELRTAGKAAKIILTTDTKQLASGWDNVAFVKASVVDENGVIVPRAKELIRFSITGPGMIAAVDNGNCASIEPFQASERSAYQGVCFAKVKQVGVVGTKKPAEGLKIVLTAQANGLESGRVEIGTVVK